VTRHRIPPTGNDSSTAKNIQTTSEASTRSTGLVGPAPRRRRRAPKRPNRASEHELHRHLQRDRRAWWL